MGHDVVFALDIGTAKVCMVAGRKNEHGRIEILGVGKVRSKGVLRGVVSNIEKTVQSILEAKEICEKSAGIAATEVYVGIAGNHISSKAQRGLLTRHNHQNEISSEDVNQLINDMNKLVLPPGDKILHIIPQEYTVDNERGIFDPVGMAGVRLEGNFHIITAQSNAMRNITRCVEKAGMRVADITLEPIASAAAVLSDEEKEAGIALLDIGGGTTDLSIYHEGILRKSVIIPFGGANITEDIKEGCKVMQENAEKLKVRFGKALSDEVLGNRYISIRGLKGREPKEISERNLACIIEARTSEIFEFALKEIEKSGLMEKMVGGMVLTGGGAGLNNISDLSEYVTGMTTRIGMPIDILAHGYSQEICDPTYSTVLGLLIHGINETSDKHIPLENFDELEEEYGHENDDDVPENFWEKVRKIFGAQIDTKI
jgi:cell division protein FtsA